MGSFNWMSGPYGPYSYPRTEADFKELSQERARIMKASREFDAARPVYERALDAPPRRLYRVGDTYTRLHGIEHTAQLARERKAAGIGL